MVIMARSSELSRISHRHLQQIQSAQMSKFSKHNRRVQSEKLCTSTRDSHHRTFLTVATFSKKFFTLFRNLRNSIHSDRRPTQSEKQRLSWREEVRFTRIVNQARAIEPFVRLFIRFTRSHHYLSHARASNASDSLSLSLSLSLCLSFCHPSSLYHFTMGNAGAVPPRRLTPRPAPRIEVPFIFESREIPRAERARPNFPPLHPRRSFSPFFCSPDAVFRLDRVILASSPDRRETGKRDSKKRIGRKRNE